ncbi:UDP-N-acetylmuramoyl-tripeptide--D-alanyl-D-alanine ligase [Blastococcus sp. MG754426]|uniref:UDP-N-acetylmuramoyl-tripeptide--D-alanyl-D- alanine ligase n=1 Tax=unclassified Blastococcus TaxID=2619396 RepID=UPI001EF04A3D|nr:MULTISPECIES: UDP-N-acetylmuramoyl-tripeptide--D-alanyl-D-alanine ligase [unclassified Blastococcus]MCF6509496.1 UDP-N-acetylmuramoyl-tripeptide--D-alanyl-D-alanine ligase [Blastococcus sp. MG754426]MCF6514092.1 UDP-N-acetylmuramoyl-tripeptide--D-alanyl-D-alanine ligase [Blastococcus sp. MG754427]MCF6737212.1 UDP-N-acetylmuramoyl-tripeptide--D-alanyl-D-alanine ligase [Blastococcus sp. KM273129]
MIRLSLHEVAQLAGGRLEGPPDGAVTGAVTLDSRAVAPGDLFVAVAGERVDGHDFLGAAAAAGAVAALVARPDPALPCVVVEDPVVALGRLAAGVHERLTAAGVRTLAITGSSGKTSTKDLLGQVLAAAGPTVSPPGSYNNDIGLPLTVLSADAGTRFLVLEMGARGRGHIARLCQVARPEVGVVLNVGSAHLGEFGSADGIAQAKGELVEALPAGGTAVLNADDARVLGMAPRTRARVLTTGRAEQAAVRAVDVALDESARARFTLVAGGERHPVSLRVVGEHQVANALSAAGAALAVGLEPAAVAAALSAAQPRSRWRMEIDRRPDGVTVVNDAYNANPESMRAALAALAGLAGTRRIAVLGGMAELGPDADAEHERLGRDAAAAGVDLVVAVGADAVGIAGGATAAGRRAGEESVHVPDRAAALALLSEVLRPGDVVLVKASRAHGLELLAADLLGGAAL